MPLPAWVTGVACIRSEDANDNVVTEGDANWNRLIDAGEVWTETTPLDSDSDDDGLFDDLETGLTGMCTAGKTTSPVLVDSDGDSLYDGFRDPKAVGLDVDALHRLDRRGSATRTASTRTATSSTARTMTSMASGGRLQRSSCGARRHADQPLYA